MKKQKEKFNGLEIEYQDNIVKVWLGSPNDIESELILALDKYYVPSLVAILSRAK